MFDELTRDLRYAARQFWRFPGFTTVALLALGLGVGATITVFKVVNAILVSPLPFEQGERVVPRLEDHLEWRRPVAFCPRVHTLAGTEPGRGEPRRIHADGLQPPGPESRGADRGVGLQKLFASAWRCSPARAIVRRE